MIKFICLDDKKEETVACTARVNKVSEDLNFINKTRQRLNEAEYTCIIIIGKYIEKIKVEGKCHTTNN